MKQLPMMSGVAGELASDNAASIDGQVVARSVGESDGRAPRGSVQAFSFGDAEPVLDRREILGYVETWINGRWYEPPVSMHGLVRAFDLPGPHSSCIHLKVNILASHLQPSRWLSRSSFRRWAQDFLATGNGYLERRDNLANRPLQLVPSLARFTRRGTKEGTYFFVPGWKQEHEYPKDRIFHLLEEHPSQEIYGIPQFLCALQAGLLGEAATLFRRRYYLNGSHAGFVFYLSEPSMNDDDAQAIRKALKESKGVGNFRNLFLHAPNGKKDGVQIIPISEVAAKDEFLNIKLVSRDEMLAAHRTPPQVVGVVPVNNGGFGDVSKAVLEFVRLEIVPLAMRFLEVNDWMGVEALRFPVLEELAKQPIGIASPAAPVN
ncbi:phage portal protein [Sphingosinicella sp. CPCC 101087]|uniref:phage portal protein n=1 Tax=Sphingosinicella sp. CPCC 101087 TaxID=2497754 RepID=UPI00101B6362|nr:phage portal protein [Sphingosinicella sp. CPCC 101087]